jgi:hypothetical protein
MNNCTLWSFVLTVVLRFMLRVSTVMAVLGFVYTLEARAGAVMTHGTTVCE